MRISRLRDSTVLLWAVATILAVALAVSVFGVLSGRSQNENLLRRFNAEQTQRLEQLHTLIQQDLIDALARHDSRTEAALRELLAKIQEDINKQPVVVEQQIVGTTPGPTVFITVSPRPSPTPSHSPTPRPTCTPTLIHRC